MRIFLDDERPAPDGWLLVESSAETIELLQRNEVELLSLDFDLHDDDTSAAVVIWLAENPDFWPTHVIVHSGNLDGEEFLVEFIQQNAPAGTLFGYGINFHGTTNESVLRTYC